MAPSHGFAADDAARHPATGGGTLYFPPTRAIHKGAAREDLTAIVKHIERDAGFEMPKTR
jgi:hypothetical protein